MKHIKKNSKDIYSRFKFYRFILDLHGSQAKEMVSKVQALMKPKTRTPFAKVYISALFRW